MISKLKKSNWPSTLLALILIIFVALIALTGCKLSTNKDSINNTTVLSNPASDTENKITPASTATQKETNNQSNTNTTKQETDKQTNTTNTKPAKNSTKTTKPSQSTKASTNEAKEVFYDQWVINQVLAYGPVGTYSREDAESLLGKSLSFSADKASCFGEQPSDITNVVTNPVYKKTVISKSDFVTNYRMTFDKLGVKPDSISEITVSDSKGNGCTFFIKDDNTLIIYGGGTYFELLRKTA